MRKFVSIKINDKEEKVSTQSILSLLGNNNLFHACFFQDIPSMLALLEKKLSQEMTELILTPDLVEIIGQQDTPIFQALMILNKLPPTENYFFPQSLSTELELLLFACIYLDKPKLFQAILVRIQIESFSPKLIKELYLVAGHYRAFEMLGVLWKNHFPCPISMIKFAFLSKFPQEIIADLWRNLDEAAKLKALRKLLPVLPIEPRIGIDIRFSGLPEPIHEYYAARRTDDILFDIDSCDSKQTDEFAEIPLISLLPRSEGYSLTELFTLLLKQEFSMFFLNLIAGIKRMPGYRETYFESFQTRYFYQLINDYLDEHQSVETASDNPFNCYFAFFKSMHATDVAIIDYLFNSGSTENQNNLSRLKSAYSLVNTQPKPFYDLITQFFARELLTQNRLTRDGLTKEGKIFLRKLLYVHQADQSYYDEIKSVNAFHGNLLPFETKEISSRLKLLGPTPKNFAITLKLPFLDDYQDYTGIPGLEGLPQVIQQLIAEFLTEEPWYTQLIENYSLLAPPTFKQKECREIGQKIDRIDTLLNMIDQYQRSFPLPFWRKCIFSKHFLSRIIYLLFLICFGVLFYSIFIFRENQVSVMHQRQNLTITPDWISCQRSGDLTFDVPYDINHEDIVVDWLSVSCSSNGITQICDQLCNTFNSIKVSKGNKWFFGISLAAFLIFCVRSITISETEEYHKLPWETRNLRRSIIKSYRNLLPETKLTDDESLFSALAAERSRLFSLLESAKVLNNNPPLNLPRRSSVSTNNQNLFGRESKKIDTRSQNIQSVHDGYSLMLD